MRSGTDITELSDTVEKHDLKALVLGDIDCGKSGLIKTWTHSLFSMQYKSSIGVDFALKVLNISTNAVVRLQLWDVAGQERFGSLTRVYYREAVMAFIVCDLTQNRALEGASAWVRNVRSNMNDANIPLYLILNNCAKYGKDTINKEIMDKFVQEHDIDAWFPVDSTLPDHDKALIFAAKRHLEKLNPIKEDHNNSTPEPVNSTKKPSFLERIGSRMGFFSKSERKNNNNDNNARIVPENNNNDNNAHYPADEPKVDKFDPQNPDLSLFEADEPKKNAPQVVKVSPPNNKQVALLLDLSKLDENKARLEGLIEDMKSLGLYNLEDENSPLSKFECPISLEVMVCPVTASDGCNYEHGYIQTYLDLELAIQKAVGGVLRGATGEVISNNTLTPNLKLQNEIIQCCEQEIKAYDNAQGLKSDKVINGNAGIGSPNLFPANSPRVENQKQEESKSLADHVNFLEGPKQ